MSTTAPTPAPYPATNARPQQWSCVNNMVTPASPATPYAVGSDCAVTAWSTEAPYPVASAGSSTVVCASPSPSTQVAVCQTAYDVHRLTGFAIPAFAVIALLVVALLVVTFGGGLRRG